MDEDEANLNASVWNAIQQAMDDGLNSGQIIGVLEVVKHMLIQFAYKESVKRDAPLSEQPAANVAGDGK